MPNNLHKYKFKKMVNKKKNLPITDFANDLFFKVASPKSPIFTLPEVPVINILSHFRSL